MIKSSVEETSNHSKGILEEINKLSKSFFPTTMSNCTTTVQNALKEIRSKDQVLLLEYEASGLMDAMDLRMIGIAFDNLEHEAVKTIGE